MRLKLKVNGLGLLMTENKQWGVRQLGPKFWQVQYRTDPTDPWGWEIIGFRETETSAIALLYLSLGKD